MIDNRTDRYYGMNSLERLKDGLIVSCQAKEGEPLYVTIFMAAMAKTSELIGGGDDWKGKVFKDSQVRRERNSLDMGYGDVGRDPCPVAERGDANR